jgi:response regulator RpfG family c-di-GMP phosphodiesterase
MESKLIAKNQPIKSIREDKRGHWPKGKRRHEASPDWPKVRKRLERLLRSPERKQHVDRPSRSRRGLAEYLGISDRQVRRWLAVDDMPSAETVTQIVAYCDLIQ